MVTVVVEGRLIWWLTTSTKGVCESMFADCFAGSERYRNNDKMKRLIDCRHDEVRAVYHEKELLDILLTMIHNLEEHITGTPRT